MNVLVFADWDGPFFTCAPGTDSAFAWQEDYLNNLDILCCRFGAKVVAISDRRFKDEPPTSMALHHAPGEYRMPVSESYAHGILEFLLRYCAAYGPTDFIIIDDDEKRYASAPAVIKNRLVLCGNRSGFTANKCKEAWQLLHALLNTSDKKEKTDKDHEL